MTTIGGKTKEIEHLVGSIKADDTGFLLDRQGGYPYGDHSVLAEPSGRGSVNARPEPRFSSNDVSLP
jgi:hypothetical protein